MTVVMAASISVKPGRVPEWVLRIRIGSDVQYE
jgi:hypothetical protein